MQYFIVFLLLPLMLYSEAVPRRVIGFWDSVADLSQDDCLIHTTIEMPLNHLGLDVEYHDIQKPLPDISNRADVRGVVVCFNTATRMRDPKAFVDWAVGAIEHGKKIVLMRDYGFLADPEGTFTSEAVQDHLYQKLGIANTQQWVDQTYGYKILTHKNELIPFELDFPDTLPGFYITQVTDPSAKSYLRAGIPGKPESETDLIVINRNGAFVSPYYAMNYEAYLYASNPRALGWHINPFHFFALAFDMGELPIPDTTTLAGRRIYFSTIHGDYWNGISQIEGYVEKEALVSEVLLEQVIIPNPDLPVSVGIVAADIDPHWVAKKKSQTTARRYLNHPQVEASSHTYSHPFYWDFFRTGGPEKEIDYLHLYPYGSWQNSFLSWFRAISYQYLLPKNFSKTRLKWGYVIPRSYANEPFDLNKEIGGAIDYINELAPETNKVKLLIWSGDSRPWDRPVELSQQAGVKNFGGGFVRFDPAYPSNLFVYPLGRKPGGFIQLYAAANAENDYTSGWTDHFYGFQYLPETLRNLESPRRLKPIHLYYHSYSGQFETSLSAVLSNIAFIRSQSVIPIKTSRFCDIGAGFYTVEFEPMGASTWKIRNRGGLQTIRFDNAYHKVVDFGNSIGVVGFIEHQKSLYVYLDAAVEEPKLALREKGNPDATYLIDSNWEVSNLKRSDSNFSFDARGWGTLSMRWKMPKGGTYVITSSAGSKSVKTSPEENILQFEVDLPYDKTFSFTVRQEA